MTMRLSAMQYPMLKEFARHPEGFYMSVEQAQHFDQRPFRSMLMRQWISYRPKKGFYITKAGREAWHAFLHTPIERKNPEAPLTSYFDPAAYGIRRETAFRRLQEIAPKKSVAA